MLKRDCLSTDCASVNDFITTMLCCLSGFFQPAYWFHASNSFLIVTTKDNNFSYWRSMPYFTDSKLDMVGTRFYVCTWYLVYSAELFHPPCLAFLVINNSPQSYWISLGSGNCVTIALAIGCSKAQRDDSSCCSMAWVLLLSQNFEGGGCETWNLGWGAETAGTHNTNLLKNKNKKLR